MDLGTIFSGLKTQGSKYTAVYTEARSAHEALAPYATSEALFLAMEEKASLSTSARKAIIQALVAEYRKGPHPLWQGLLVKAFEPMMRRLRGQLRGDKDECDQRVVLAFLEALGRLPELDDPDAVTGYMRIATARAVFLAMQEERSAPATERFLEENHPVGEGVEDGLIDVIDLQRALRRAPKTRKAGATAELLEVGLTDGDSLWAYVDRTHQGLRGAERNRVYRRLQQQRNRLMKRMRARLGDRTPAILRRLLAA